MQLLVLGPKEAPLITTPQVLLCGALASLRRQIYSESDHDTSRTSEFSEYPATLFVPSPLGDLGRGVIADGWNKAGGTVKQIISSASALALAFMEGINAQPLLWMNGGRLTLLIVEVSEGYISASVVEVTSPAAIPSVSVTTDHTAKVEEPKCNDDEEPDPPSNDSALEPKELGCLSVRVLGTYGTLQFGMQEVDDQILRCMHTTLAGDSSTNKPVQGFSVDKPITWRDLTPNKRQLLMEAARQTRRNLMEEAGSFEAAVEVSDAVEALCGAVAEQVAKQRKEVYRDRAPRERVVRLDLEQLTHAYRHGNYFDSITPSGASATSDLNTNERLSHNLSIQAVLDTCVKEALVSAGMAGSSFDMDSLHGNTSGLGSTSKVKEESTFISEPQIDSVCLYADCFGGSRVPGLRDAVVAAVDAALEERASGIGEWILMPHSSLVNGSKKAANIEIARILEVPAQPIGIRIFQTGAHEEISKLVYDNCGLDGVVWLLGDTTLYPNRRIATTTATSNRTDVMVRLELQEDGEVEVSLIYSGVSGGVTALGEVIGSCSLCLSSVPESIDNVMEEITSLSFSIVVVQARAFEDDVDILYVLDVPKPLTSPFTLPWPKSTVASTTNENLIFPTCELKVRFTDGLVGVSIRSLNSKELKALAQHRMESIQTDINVSKEISHTSEPLQFSGGKALRNTDSIDPSFIPGLHYSTSNHVPKNRQNISLNLFWVMGLLLVFCILLIMPAHVYCDADGTVFETLSPFIALRNKWPEIFRDNVRNDLCGQVRQGILLGLVKALQDNPFTVQATESMSVAVNIILERFQRLIQSIRHEQDRRPVTASDQSDEASDAHELQSAVKTSTVLGDNVVSIEDTAVQDTSERWHSSLHVTDDSSPTDRTDEAIAFRQTLAEIQKDLLSDLSMNKDEKTENKVEAQVEVDDSIMVEDHLIYLSLNK